MFNSGSFDAKRLLDQFLTPQAGTQAGTQGGVPATQNSLGGLLGGLTGGLSGITGSANAQPPGAGAPGAASGAGDLMGRAKDYLGNNGGSLASGAAAGALVSLVLGSKGGRKMAGSAMLYVTNEDKPGFVGRFASLLGDAGLNIATFALGRDRQGGDAIALVEVDGTVPGELLAKVQQLPSVKQAKPLVF